MGTTVIVTSAPVLLVELEVELERELELELELDTELMLELETELAIELLLEDCAELELEEEILLDDEDVELETELLLKFELRLELKLELLLLPVAAELAFPPPPQADSEIANTIIGKKESVEWRIKTPADSFLGKAFRIISERIVP